MSLVIGAEPGERDQQEWRNSDDELKSRINAAGMIVTGVNAGPTASDLVKGELAIWFDSTNSKVKFYAINASETFVGAEILLTAPPP